MIWLLLIIVGLLIFCPVVAGIAGLAILAVAIPFLIFFAIWGIAIFVTYQIDQSLLPFGVIGGFVIGVYIARKVVLKFTNSN